jgi:hypothetical protein
MYVERQCSVAFEPTLQFSDRNENLPPSSHDAKLVTDVLVKEVS